MKVYKYILTGWLLALLLGWGCLLVGCTDQTDTVPERPDAQEGEPLHVAGLTRTGDEEVVDPMMNQFIQLFVVGVDTQSASLKYMGKNDPDDSPINWGSEATLLVKPGSDYKIFGFMPADVPTGTGHDVTVNGNTATMTIKGLPTITNQDFCIVIGVKGGKLTGNETVTQGVFDYHAPENTAEGFGVSLLADHFLAAVKVKVKVGYEYNTLRTIMLKQVNLVRADANKVDATMPLVMNNNGTNPMTTFPQFSTVSSDTLRMAVFQSENSTPPAGDSLKVNKTIDFMGYFTTDNVTKISIESIYDIYDKHGQLLRSNCKAVNSLANALRGMVDGQRKTINLTVEPTYLYMLSDWDSPMWVVE